MLDIAQFYVNNKKKIIRLSVKKQQIRNIGLLFTNQGANSPQNTCIISNGQFQTDRVDRWVFPAVPLQIDPSFRLLFEVFQSYAVDRMNNYSLPAVGNAHNPFARRGLATPGTPKGLIRLQPNNRAIHVNFFATLCKLWVKQMDDIAGRQFSRSQTRQQFVGVRNTQLLGGGL